MLVYRPLHRPLHIQYQSLYQPSINRDLGFRFGRVSVEYQSSDFIFSQTHPPLLFSGLGSLFLLFILLFSLPILLNLTRDAWHSLSLSYVSLLLSLLAMISINVKGSLNQDPGHNHENT